MLADDGNFFKIFWCNWSAIVVCHPLSTASIVPNALCQSESAEPEGAQ